MFPLPKKMDGAPVLDPGVLAPIVRDDRVEPVLAVTSCTFTLLTPPFGLEMYETT